MDFSSLSDQSSHAAFSLCTTSTSFTCSRVAVCACCMWWRWRRIYGEVITCFPPALIHLKFFRFMDSFFRRVTLLSLASLSWEHIFFDMFQPSRYGDGASNKSCMAHIQLLSHTPDVIKYSQVQWIKVAMANRSRQAVRETRKRKKKWNQSSHTHKNFNFLSKYLPSMGKSLMRALNY